ncbi:tannase/feruloyl esterase family alpha/beta hydrolase [Phenylobacterium sp. J367]|uniref:tannase/feruloyl esterase family alpha/beta hydrolase n=1 Tax=Phenylobacterium sp. J367 TaxID=2898435 RepID=UPI002151A1EB|nr:tannase/feruloyl esterase family alpha/beta hydrolase [Phenylobacterium sp. J367]MCR5879246.1 tannase/feruloyl esterase family alpha/beta hydrolase [Phenylobacterium sp. J367]
MSAGLRRGYVTAVTDTGTAPATPLAGDALIGQPVKWRDWGRRSTHAMTVTGKAVAQAFYGTPARRAFYTGCSTGGQQGLIEALYYPEDYDGILVGAPVINRTWGHGAVLWNDLAAHLKPGHRLSDAKLRLLSDTAVQRCGGAGSGLAGDPFIGDPKACRFDPAVLACRDGDRADCLTAAEVATARAFYSGPTSRAGRPLFHGWLPGSEATGFYDWTFLQSRPNGEPAFVSLFKWVFGAKWDWSGFQVERDMARVDRALGPIVNDATRGSLRDFRARGGKLIIYHGWADSLVPPDQSVAFYDRAARDAGGLDQVQDFARLFMAPGFSHCAGGPGPDVFNSASGGAIPTPTLTPQHDLFAALETWVDGGPAPAQVIATRYVGGQPAKGIAMQRPLCAYPAKAWYRGAGDPNDARNFTCAVVRPRGAGRRGRRIAGAGGAGAGRHGRRTRSAPHHGGGRTSRIPPTDTDSAQGGDHRIRKGRGRRGARTPAADPRDA